jgi:hypothetical protein
MTNSDDTIQAEVAEDLSPHNRALYEAGKKLLVESINVGREFCKFMTTTVLSAIPLYLGLLKLVLPKDYVLQYSNEITFLIPPVVFLFSSILFILGYFPQSGQLSLDIPDEIERERNITIRRRKRFAVVAFMFFAFGIIYGSWQIINTLGISR